MTTLTFQALPTHPVAFLAIIVVYVGFIIQTISVTLFIWRVSCKAPKVIPLHRALSSIGVILFYLCCICDSLLITTYIWKGDDTNAFYVIHTILAVQWDIATMILYIFFLHRIESISDALMLTTNKCIIFKPMNKENCMYNFVIILIISQLIVRAFTFSKSLEYIGSFGKIILSTVVSRNVLNMNEYVTMDNNDSGSIQTDFDCKDRKLINIVSKLWTLTQCIANLSPRAQSGHEKMFFEVVWARVGTRW
eukprot:227950_1